MVAVSVRRRVRPLRFLFLIDHHNAVDLKRAIQVNTILWAGMFNAIVPTFRRTPQSWLTSRTATEIVAGYVDAFEPDFVITGAGVDASAYGVLPPHSATLASMLTLEGLGRRGMSVREPYRWRYRNEFRFVQRDPLVLHNLTSPNRKLALFAAAVFGEFPAAPLDFFAKGFRDLGGEESPLPIGGSRATRRRDLPRTGTGGTSTGAAGTDSGTVK